MEEVIKLIEDGIENDHVDFKAKDYNKNNKVDFIKDINAMANSNYDGDKYIIVGIKDHKEKEREIIGIELNKESAEFEQLIHENIEPTIKVEYRTFIYDDKLIGYYKILKENKDKPYMVKKNYSNSGKTIKAGECYIRKNSTNTIALRYDFDMFYKSRNEVKLSIRGNFICINTIESNDDLAPSVFAPLEIEIFNKSVYKVIFKGGYLKVKNSSNEELCLVGVVGYGKKYQGADFQLELNARDRYYGDILLGFGSNDCVALGLDGYGESTEKYKFELMLFDTEGNEYIAYDDECFIIAKGNVLHKVRFLSVYKEEGFINRMLKRK